MLITASKTTKRACLKERAHVLVAALEANERGERRRHKGGHRALACSFARAHRENRASACGRGSVASDCRGGGRGRKDGYCFNRTSKGLDKASSDVLHRASAALPEFRQLPRPWCRFASEQRRTAT